ncbi:MAG: ketoacyl-ACP synthase III [Bacteroidota bacterium]
MNISSIRNVKIEAISACVPKNKIDNRQFAKDHFPDDLENTIKALGIDNRHVCKSEKSTALDLCIEAAKTLFNNTSITPLDIGGLVFITLTPDNLMPNNASLAQHLLDLPQSIPAFDINHACSGYIYGLWIASMMAQNLKKRVLLLDGDTNSHYVSPWDKATGLLFGDAGSATIISPSNESSEWFFTFETDGSNREALIIPGIGFRHLLTQESLEYKIYEDGSRRRFIDMYMKGEDVFSYVVTKVPKIINEFLDELDLISDEFDFLLLHQANAFMLRKLARKINFDTEKMPISINKYGNTSSVSIPLNICSELRDKLSLPSKALLVGMGAGLSTGAAIVELGPLFCSGVKEIEI